MAHCPCTNRCEITLGHKDKEICVVLCTAGELQIWYQLPAIILLNLPTSRTVLPQALDDCTHQVGKEHHGSPLEDPIEAKGCKGGEVRSVGQHTTCNTPHSSPAQHCYCAVAATQPSGRQHKQESSVPDSPATLSHAGQMVCLLTSTTAPPRWQCTARHDMT